jgi:predicted O-linked N-acetylglucosamine transferase (SPINDLY family)
MAKKTKKTRLPSGLLKKSKQIAGPPGLSFGQGLLQQALAHHRAGRLPQAENLYRQILLAEPTHPEALYLLGTLASQVGKNEIAVELISKAVSYRPDYIEAYNYLGFVFLTQGRTDEAIATYQRLLAMKPGYVEAHYNIGIALQTQGKLDGAAASFRRALAITPNYADAHLNLGVTLKMQDKLEEAAASYRRALALKPDYAVAYNNLGIIFKDQGKLGEAIASFRQALSLNLDSAETYSNLAGSLMEQGRLDEAVANFRRALAVKPDFAGVHSNLLFCLNYLPHISQQEIYQQSLQWDAQVAKRLPNRDPVYANRKDLERKLRIGYVSSDFKNHSVAYFIEPVLKAHDRKNVEVHCYANVRKPDDRTQRLQNVSDHWHSIAGMQDVEAAERIREDRIDILVDLGGHTKENRLLVFACKPSPIQVTWLGYPNTTGMRAIDYRFTDAIADPPGEMDNFHSEKLIRLEHGFLCYQPEASAPEISPPPCLDLGEVTFGSFNNLPKVTPEVVRLWAEILRRQPQSRLLLKSKPLADLDTRERYLRLFTEQGIAADRLELHGWLPDKTNHLGLYNRIDIALDSFPYNGTTTTCEALWMGVPVVTLCGNRHAARVGASIMHHAELEELVARSEEEYIALAVALAQDRQRLITFRSNQRQKLQESQLMDNKLFTATLEKAYRRMWREWCA